jgi:hypothetical protein
MIPTVLIQFIFAAVRSLSLVVRPAAEAGAIREPKGNSKFKMQ